MESVQRWVSRSDAWTPEDDQKLADLVLDHIQTGSTQLRAFEEAASLLGRTNAACGYRWNGVVRRHYREEIESAKRLRKSNAKAAPKGPSPVEPVVTTVTSSDSLNDVLHFLEQYGRQYQSLLVEVDRLNRERTDLVMRVQDLESRLSSVPRVANGPVTPAQLEEDSKTLFAIMERARKLLEIDPGRE